MNKTYIIISAFILFLISCSEPTLNGHYHLHWSNNHPQFQVWNIKDNRMKINEEVCEIKDSCFYSRISFRGGKIEVRPWVDIVYEAEYKLFKDSSLFMYTNYEEIKDTLKLIPHTNCILSKEYFQKLTNKYTTDFNLESDLMTGSIKNLPVNNNELVIGIKDSNAEIFLLYNKRLIKSINELSKDNKSKDNSIWIHIDSKVQLKQIVGILEYLNKNGYLISFSAKSLRENKEQIQILKRGIITIKIKDNQTELDICEFCENHLNEKVDSLFNIQVINKDNLVVQGDTVDLFQTRNRIVRYLEQNKYTRLNTLIQVNIPDNLNFSK